LKNRGQHAILLLVFMLNNNKENQIIFFSIILALGIFLFDLSAPLGIAAAVPYSAVILLSLWLPEKRNTIIAGTGVTVLTILGIFLSPAGDVPAVFLINRVLSLIVIWTSAIFVLKYKHSLEVIQEHAEALNRANMDLINQSKELKRSNEELEKSRQKFRNLSAHLQDLREAERKYIAAELHDELGGLFTAIKMELSLMTSNTPGNQEKLRRAGESLVKLADTGIETVRRISMELRPEILDHLGLISAIQWYMSEFQKRARIRCKCLLSKEDIQMNKNRTTAVFRILQEAMTNVARHSEATKVTVEVKKDEDTMIMKIEDNGKGINEEKINDPFSFGLLGMQERTLYLGGELKISGTPNKGTRVMATIPISEKGK